MWTEKPEDKLPIPFTNSHFYKELYFCNSSLPPGKEESQKAIPKDNSKHTCILDSALILFYQLIDYTMFKYTVIKIQAI